MADVNKTYLPAAGRDWALPFYDPFVKLIGGEKDQRILVEQATLHAGQRVLDIGCGTGTLAVAIKKRWADIDVTGIDPDPKALARAERKARRAATPIRFDQGFADQLPYPDGSFDRVFSTFMFHHLKREQQDRVLREVRRVLAPGGSLHLLDFEHTESHGGRIDHFEGNSEERLLELMRRAGFPSCARTREGTTLFGLLRMGYYRAM